MSLSIINLIDLALVIAAVGLFVVSQTIGRHRRTVWLSLSAACIAGLVVTVIIGSLTCLGCQQTF